MIKSAIDLITLGSELVKHLQRPQYDPIIIEMTIGLGPFTSLYIPFLKHCFLTNKAVRNIRWALFKPSQRRRGPHHHLL